MLIVGFDNVLHQLVTNHVPLVEVDELDALDVSQNLPYPDQARNPFRRQIHLGNIARDNHFGMKPEPREKHLHLLRRSVLRFVWYEEGVVKRGARDTNEWGV